MVIYGVGVSETDGNVDWLEMKEKGIGFAMLRAGYGSGSIDLQFRKNAESCNRLGIPCGAYWLSYAYDVEKAKREADFFVETVEEFELACPLCVKYDFSSVRYAEWKGVQVTGKFAEEMVKAFCRRVERKGYSSMYLLEWNGRWIASGTEMFFNLYYS